MYRHSKLINYSIVGLLVMIGYIAVPSCSRADGSDGIGQQRSAISLGEIGKNANGQTLYNLRSDNADVSELLRMVFNRKGEANYFVGDDIKGTVSLNVRGVTLDDILTLVQTSVPTIKITSGPIVRPTRDLKAIASRIQSQLDLKYITPGQVSALTTGISPDAPLSRLVTLNIPDSNPTTLANALATIEHQTRVSIKLDARVPADVKFIATVTSMPLGSLLDKIAPAAGFGALKWVAMNNYILIAPADRLQVMTGPQVLGSALVCVHCNQPLATIWSYCPNCGQLTQRGMVLPNPVNKSIVPKKPE